MPLVVGGTHGAPKKAGAGHIVGNAPAASWVTLLATLIGSFLIETVYRKRTGRHFERLANPPAGPPPVAATASHG